MCSLSAPKVIRQLSALIRSTESLLYGRFTDSTLNNTRGYLTAVNSQKFSEASSAALKPQESEIYTESQMMLMNDAHKTEDRSSSRLLYNALFSLPARSKKYISAQHKANHKCYSRMRLNILGFLYLISVFFWPLLKNDILTFVTMAIMCSTIGPRERRRDGKYPSIDAKEILSICGMVKGRGSFQ